MLTLQHVRSRVQTLNGRSLWEPGYLAPIMASTVDKKFALGSTLPYRKHLRPLNELPGNSIIRLTLFVTQQREPQLLELLVYHTA